MDFRFELHAHTCEVSCCARVCGAEMARAYKAAGYSGVVVTDHMSDARFSDLDSMSGGEIADVFLRGYHAAKAEENEAFTVLLGMEIRFYENNNDYLVYGMTEAFLRRHPKLLQLGIAQFSALARENGMLVFQAHPFRNGMTVTRPDLLDGVEVANNCVRHDSRNEIAKQWAEKFGLLRCGGSDYHQLEDVARGGILTEFPIRTQADLLRALQGEGKIIE